MERVSSYRYNVAQGEVVTFEISPIGTAPTVTGVQNGQALANLGNDDHMKFQFTVTEPVGSLHAAIVNCTFQAGGSEAAHFEISVSGSGNGLTFQVPSIDKQTATNAPNFRFDVV